jgi:tRNA 2-thiouridine synthesizing protein E
MTKRSTGNEATSLPDPSFYDVDEEGFLEDPGRWDRNFAEMTAEGIGLNLTDQHWELIEATRRFYSEYGFAPSMRPLVKHIGTTLDHDKGSSLYLLSLFPGSPAKLLSLLAGLHKPENCL